MSDKFYPIPIEKLAAWMLRDLHQDQLFGIHRSLWFQPNPHQPFRMRRYGQLLETPIGVAAGPHTQLAQNIITAWLTGARYMELKTVQTLDAIEVTKPCIDMSDEGYNCEWSQELQLQQSFDEYLNGWIIIHWLRHHLGWDHDTESGLIFNMSVGYDLAGIQNPNVQTFLDKMVSCPVQLSEKLNRLKGILPGLGDIQIPQRMTDNITLSTMHGCPPDEIERIGKYLIHERKLHTTIKLNPTLLGPDQLRDLLHNQLGFNTIHVPDLAFEHDLKYDGALDLIRSLQIAAGQAGVEFGIKLTNTLEVENLKGNLPDNEPMVYMSGRALHPISVLVAEKLQSDFDGQLDISFSAGADAFNLAEILECNIRPVTVCSDLLKPGGYARLHQYLEILNEKILATGSTNLTEFILSHSDGEEDVTQAGLANLKAYAGSVSADERYHQHHFPNQSIKTDRPLMTFDCIAAPCINECAVNQDIPGYMYHAAQGDFQRALEIILRNNPMPHVAGLVCDHLCQSKCTRINYDRPLLIRGIKHFIAEHANGKTDPRCAPFNGHTVAIIGGGPAGLSAAYFLAQDGFEVEIFESKSQVGGMTAGTIPSFRMDAAGLAADVARIKRLGVIIHTGTEINPARFEALRSHFDYIFVAVGAQVGKRLDIPGEKYSGVLDQLTFLQSVHSAERPKPGDSVLVIGGGNSAMDAARTAKRIVGTKGSVTVVYRRTVAQMPADRDEIGELGIEGIKLIELTAPVEILEMNGHVTGLRCQKMVLGEIDASGRRQPVAAGEPYFDIPADVIISAIGQEVVLDFFPEHELKVDPQTLETQIHDIFAGGDAVRGPATLIKAIGDGRHVAQAIRKKANLRSDQFYEPHQRDLTRIELQQKQAVRDYGPALVTHRSNDTLGFDLMSKPLDAESAKAEASRCLFCDERCSVCVSVCPNRANVEFTIRPRVVRVSQGILENDVFQPTQHHLVTAAQTTQIFNVGDFCNECGNCTTFCPTKGQPFRTKPKFWLSSESFAQEESGHHFADGVLHHSHGKTESSFRQINGRLEYTTPEFIADFDPIDFHLIQIEALQSGKVEVDLRHAGSLYFLWDALKDHPMLRG